MNDEFDAEETAALAAMKEETPAVEVEPSDGTVEAVEQAGDAPVEAPDEAPQKPPEGFVPHGAMHAEREAKKAAELRAQEAERALEEANAKVAEFESTKDAPPTIDQRVAGLPDPLTDFDGFKASLTEILQATDKPVQEVRQQFSAQEHLRDVQSFVISSEAAFKSETPDYDAAAAHLKEVRSQELRMLGTPEAQIPQVIAREVMQIAEGARRRSENPAKVFYDLATVRGYQKKEAEPDAGEKIARLAQAQESQKSLSSASGKPAGEYDLKTLAEMPEEELAEVLDKNPNLIAKLQGAA